MLTEHQTTVKLQVQRSGEREGLYHLSTRRHGDYQLIGEIQLPEIEDRLPEYLALLNPWEFLSHYGKSTHAELEKLFSSKPSLVEISLPSDPIATVNWELIIPDANVLRRPLNSPQFTLPAISTPMRWGIVPLVEERLLVSKGLVELIDSLNTGAFPTAVNPSLLDTRGSLQDLISEIDQMGIQGLHVLLKTKTDASDRHIRFGREDISLKSFIQKIARGSARFVLLHDLSLNRLAGISALRLDSQNLPRESSTALMLFAEPLHSRQITRSLSVVYQSVFQDWHLGTCIGQLHTALQHTVYASAVANVGIDRPFDFEITSRGLKDKLSRLKGQRIKLGLREPSINPYELFTDRFDADESILDEWDDSGGPRYRDSSARRSRQPILAIKNLERLEELVRDEEQKQKPAIAEVYRQAVEDVSQTRFPVTLFYQVMGNDVTTPIPKIQSLSSPAPGIVLEFHFWIDVIEGGMDYVGERPAIIKPEAAPYPITLLVEVWSEDFKIRERRRTLILEASGPTQEHARFPVELPAPDEIPKEGKRGEIFVFLRYQGEAGQKELVAVFRVEALITREPEEHKSAQILEHAYLASSWFKFKDPAVGSAATIFLAKKAGLLQVFTLMDTDVPWGTLGANEQAVYQLSEKIYRYLHHLSIEAAKEQEQGQDLSFEKSATGLANLGFELFTTVFLSPQTSESVRTFIKDFLLSLPKGSTVTIALNKETNGFIIPWGLMYDQLPPTLFASSMSTFFGSLEAPPQQDAFWGVRFNLVVRPSISSERAPVTKSTSLRIGAAWHNHVETEKLRKNLKELVDNGSIVIKPLRAQNQTIPGLASNEFDLIHFYCHGHSSLPGKDIDPFLVRDYETLAAISADQEVKELSWEIAQVPPKPSFMLLDGGAATYPALSYKLDRLKGQPIVLLSMCESAQVTCAGAGFVTLFLDRGARSVIGTEGPTLWSLGREMDTQIIRRLLDGQNIGQAFSEIRRELVKKNVLALIYSLFGDSNAKLTFSSSTHRQEKVL